MEMPSVAIRKALALSLLAPRSWKRGARHMRMWHISCSTANRHETLNLNRGGKLMGDGKRFGMYTIGFIIAALSACFVIGFLVIPTLMPTQEGGGPAGVAPASHVVREGIWA